MKLQGYLVKAKKQAFDKERCDMWMATGSKGTRITCRLDYT